MDLVEVGHGAVPIRQIADRADVGDVAVHGIDALEGDQLRAVARRDQQFLEMGEVVVAEDALLAAGMAHALDHRVVVEGVRQDQAVRDQLGDGRDAGLVRDVARGEDEARLLAVQVGEFALQVHQRRVVARDVAGAAGAHAAAGGRAGHGADHVRVLAHAEVVVRAPYGDLGGAAVGLAPMRGREAAGDAFDIGEDAVAALAVQAVQGGAEVGLVIGSAALGGASVAARAGFLARSCFVSLILIVADMRFTASVLHAWAGGRRWDRGLWRGSFPHGPSCGGPSMRSVVRDEPDADS